MLTVYTDGSCLPNPSEHGAWSFVVYDDGREIAAISGRAESCTTSNRMEQTAVLRALTWLGDRPATLHTDSQYVVSGLNSWCRAWQRRGWMRKDKATRQLVPVMNTDLWQEMVIARRPQHRIAWCKGHAGIVGNERADSLAEAARKGMPA